MKFWLMFLVAILLIGGIVAMGVHRDNHPLPPTAQQTNSESENSGVVVHGYACQGWIKNTNIFPVRIKGVFITSGEITTWVEVFQPREVKDGYINGQSGFHIYTLDGIEIGWVRPLENGSEEPNDQTGGLIY